FRGFEAILEGRPPSDALVIAPRICGICSVSQSIAAAAALADAQGARAPRNGRLAAHLAHACENLADHLTHFYLFFAPDLARAAYADRPWFEHARARFAVPDGAGRTAALAARAKFLHVTGLIAGKWPHTLALQPGGATNPLDQGARVRVMAAIGDFRRYLEEVVYGEALEAFAALEDLDALAAWREARAPADSDVAFFLHVAEDLGFDALGPGPERYLSYGAYHDEEDGPAFRAGCWRGEVEPLDLGAIAEDVAHARYAGLPAAPERGTTLPVPDKTDAYSWCKAPRYDGAPAETGAFARQLVDGQPLLTAAHAESGSNVRNRVLARWVEVARVVPLMERWARSLAADGSYFEDSGPVEQGAGVGVTEAARGSLGHWLAIEDGRIARYQIVAPTTWNFSPRDAAGVPGPLEAALEGAPVGKGETTPLSVQHIVRSFDPCMVCTVH
ncbi:MAG: nickel-dependent hydrogenase large subunit, partial [Caulobacterales bacterium]|nr:nickel-dependent hydrogenase large subunit [Caulobacterales bacterium]